MIHLTPVSDRRRTSKGWIMPTGYRPGGCWIDMRPSGHGEGLAVLETHEPYHHHAVRPVAATADEQLSRRALRCLGNAFGVTLKRSRTVAEAVIETAQIRTGVFPVTVNGEHEVYLSRRLVHRKTVIRHRDAVKLGDWLFCAFGCHLWWPEREVWLPAIAGGTTFTESWPSSGNTITSGLQSLTWTIDVGTWNTVNAGSPNFVTLAGAPGLVRAAASAVTVHHKTTGTFIVSTTNDNTMWVYARIAYAGSGNNYTGYATIANRFDPGETLVKDNFTVLDSDAIDPGAAAYTMFVQASGTTISGGIDANALGPATDSTHTTETTGGVKITGNPGEVQWRSWSIEDVAGSFPSASGHALVNRWRGDEMTHPPVPVGGGTY